MDYSQILKTKPNIERHLNRYIKIISSIKDNKKRKINENSYLEEHHICPKSKDLFPEYKNLKTYDWNKIYVTPKEHYICHLLLYKAYPYSSQVKAFKFFLNRENNIKSSRLYEMTRLEYIEKMKTDSVWNNQEFREKFNKEQSQRMFLRWSDEETKKSISKNISNAMRYKLDSDEGYKSKMVENAKYISTTYEAKEKIRYKAVERNSKEEYRKMISDKTKIAMNTEEISNKLKLSWEIRKLNILVCPYCGKEGVNNMKRYHFEKCKYKLQEGF